MEVISIDGVEYVRAAQVAKRFKYTSDYIGQLCRSGKVDAKLVGRTWYVNPDSIDGHKNARYTKSSTNEKTSTTSTQIKISRQNVEPVIRKETVKSLSAKDSSSSNFLRRIEWKPLRYETDDADLLPRLNMEVPTAKVPVNLAGSTKIAITNQSRETTLVTEPLPEVALAGSLKVSSLDDNFEKDLENIDISDIAEEDFDAEEVSRAETVVVHESPKPKAPVRAHKSRITNDPKNPTYPVAINKQPGSLFVPELVMNRGSDEDVKKVSYLPWLLLLLLSTAATILILSLERTVVSSATVQSSSFTFSEPSF